MKYEEMLKKARNEMPDVVFIKERFEIPKVRGHIQGNKTVISNFRDIATTLGRPVEHMMKFVVKELAAPGGMKGNNFILGTKIAASRINDKIRQYAHEYVLCSACGKPDTKLEKEGNVTYLKCAACGAKRQVK